MDSNNPYKSFAVIFALATIMIANLALIFFWTPTEMVMGIVQKVLYLHVPLAWIGFLAFFVVFIGSVMYLWKKTQRWDGLAQASAEVGVLCTTLMLVTGAIWAKPVWGVWWTWDPKLTLTLVLWFVYAAYMMLRAYGPKGSQGARYGSVLALVGAIDAPIVYYAAELWRSTHPSHVIGVSAESGSLPTEMAIALVISLLTFSLLFAYLIIERYVLRRAETDIDELFRSFT